jgi:hypothetical protein
VCKVTSLSILSTIKDVLRNLGFQVPNIQARKAETYLTGFQTHSGSKLSFNLDVVQRHE